MLINILKFIGIILSIAFLLYLSVRLAAYAVYKSKKEINSKK